MRKRKKILGMLLFVLTFSLISNVKADYYRLNTFKSNDELLTFQYECQENVMCTITPTIEAVWDENSTPTGEGRVYLGQWYAGYTYEARNFSMVLSGSVDTSKNYVVSLTSDYMDSQVTYTGEEINTGITITIGESFGTLTVTVKEEGTNTNVNYWKFNNDGLLPEDITEPDTKSGEFETVYLNFNSGKQQQNQNPGYQQPQEDPEEKAKMEALLDEIAPEGKIKLDTVDPTKTNAEEGLYDSLVTAAFVKQYDVGKYSAFVYPKSEYVETPYIELGYYNYENGCYTSYTKEVEIEYQKKDDSIDNMLTEIRKKLNHDFDYYTKDYNNNFNIVDLESLNYYYNIQNSKNSNASYYLIPSYSSKIHELTNNLGFDFMFDPRAGGANSLFYEPIIGPINILYNGIVVDNINPIGFTLTNILYIPSDTQKTREAFIKAAQDRINEYFPGQKIEIKYEDKIEELYENEYSWSVWDEETNTEKLIPLFDLEQTNGEFYTITIGETVYPYFIVADSSKMNTPITKSVDMNTNVKVESGSYDVPLDTRLNVTKLDKNSEEFKKIAEKVKILDDNVYDIDLLSTSLDMKIEKLSNGNFKVYIPISEENAKKSLVAVYVKEDGTLEEHEIKIEDGYAVFETNHFSTYSISETKQQTTNPATGDKIMKYTIILGISILGITGLTIYTKKSKKTK